MTTATEIITTDSSTDKRAFLARIKENPGERATRLAYADWLDENGEADAAMHQRRIGDQETVEGSRVVTVARDGQKMAKCGGRFSVPIYCTAIYTAKRRADGLMTWRRTGSYSDGTAGRRPTGPMIDRATARAEELGVPFVSSVGHGNVCD